MDDCNQTVAGAGHNDEGQDGTCTNLVDEETSTIVYSSDEDDVEGTQGTFSYHQNIISNTVGDTSSQSRNIDSKRPTRVLKDIFHLIEMIPISLKHGLAKEFKRRLRDALFIVDEDDKKLVQERYIIKRKGETWERLLLHRPKWLLRRVRRYVPSPDELYSIVKQLFDTLGPLPCNTTNRPLFDKQSKKYADNVLKYIQTGYVSDPDGIPLYFKVRVDCYGLPIYRCARGTNSVEGSVHQNIIRKFGSFNTSADLADCALADYRLRHNTDVMYSLMSFVID